MRDWSHLMIHHSLTEDTGSVSWGAIRRYHVDTNGWSAIGYHFGVELLRDEYEVLFGRSWNRPGAHCRHDGMNRKALGICCVGNYDDKEPPAAMLDVLAGRLVGPLMDDLAIPKDRVVFHRDHNPHKSCPGRRFKKEHILDRL